MRNVERIKNKGYNKMTKQEQHNKMTKQEQQNGIVHASYSELQLEELETITGGPAAKGHWEATLNPDGSVTFRYVKH